jgi:hypothetical protein
MRLTGVNGNRGSRVNAKDDGGVRAPPVFGSANIWEPLIVEIGGETSDDVSSSGCLETYSGSWEVVTSVIITYHNAYGQS